MLHWIHRFFSWIRMPPTMICKKQALEERKTQLLQIPDGMSTLETQYESLQTTLFQLETQKAAIQTKKQEAIQQFTDAETELNIQQQQLSGELPLSLEQQEQKLTSARQELGAGLAELKLQEQNA